MFELSLYDRNGEEINIGDIVKVSDGKKFNFYCEVKYIESEGIITPFHTFTFHSFVKVDDVPDNAHACDEQRYKMWFVYSDEAETDSHADDANNYLMQWRKCEYFMRNRMWRIKSVPNVAKQESLF